MDDRYGIPTRESESEEFKLSMSELSTATDPIIANVLWRQVSFESWGRGTLRQYSLNMDR